MQEDERYYEAIDTVVFYYSGGSPKTVCTCAHPVTAQSLARTLNDVLKKGDWDKEPPHHYSDIWEADNIATYGPQHQKRRPIFDDAIRTALQNRIDSIVKCLSLSRDMLKANGNNNQSVSTILENATSIDQARLNEVLAVAKALGIDEKTLKIEVES